MHHKEWFGVGFVTGVVFLGILLIGIAFFEGDTYVYKSELVEKEHAEYYLNKENERQWRLLPMEN